jgi:hypothetical protein
VLLLAGGGMGNEAWAATKNVTYHVITLPFGGSGSFLETATNGDEYRIEAIKMKVTQDDKDPIKLPAELKSPLMKYEAYSYYLGVTKSGLKKIFPDNDSQFYTYSDFTNNVTGKKVSELSGTDVNVYVTYYWDDDHENLKEDYGKKLDLTGKKKYNIEFNNGKTSWFYGLNMNPDRGNRAQAIPKSKIKNIVTDLCSDDPVTINGSVNGKTIFYFQWKLINNDPYNIILQTAYNGHFVYTEDGYKKTNLGAQLFGSLELNSIKTRHNWMSNEVNKAYVGPTENDTVPKHGFFRGTTGEGRELPKNLNNGELYNLYFSFTLLAHPTANYTLAASWVAVDDHDWIPKYENGTYKYMLMYHDPEDRPCAGPALQALTAADQIRLYEIRDYNFKVNTPLSNTILSSSLKWSDYGKDSLLINHVPDALKRKYTTIEGTYADAAFNTKRTTFFDLYNNDEPEVKKPRDIWLKYEVLPSKFFFEAGTSSSTFDDQKWYNIYVNKEEKYTAWYDTSGEHPQNVFNTSEGSSGHTKYAHESHFSFIGDPYELRVVNRLASEDAGNKLRYMKLGAVTTDPLVSGTCNTSADYTYRPLPNGTALTIGNKYYTNSVLSSEVSDQFTSGDLDGSYYQYEYVGQVSNGSNYFEKIDYYDAVLDGTLTQGKVYYTSDKGDGIFVSNGTEVASVEHPYYTYNSHYVEVPDGTRLTIGKTYYTSITGTGKFVAKYLEANGTDYRERLYSSNWEIINDNNSGNNVDCFRLRQFNTYDDPVTIGWGTSGSRPLNGDGGDGTNLNKVARLWVIELPMMEYTYFVVDKSDHIAVMATEEQFISSELSYNSIPDIIRSSFLEYGNDEGWLTFHTYIEDPTPNFAVFKEEDKTVDWTKLSSITATNSDESKKYRNYIFVKYDTGKLKELSSYPLDDTDAKSLFNVRLNAQYIYYNGGSVNSTTAIPASDDTGTYQWVLGGRDPYAMTIRNKAAGNYVNTTWSNEAPLGWDTQSNASKFIIKRSGDNEYAYEVMATTGVAYKTVDGKTIIDVENSVNASKTYYNIGRKDETTVQMYSDDIYKTGIDELRFELKPIQAHNVTYHLIDLAGKDLLRVTIRHIATDVPRLPAEWVSPLVDEYYYYLNNETNFDYSTSEHVYTLKSTAVKLDAIGENTEVYVIYKPNSIVDLHHTTMYLMKYETGEQFYQENGSDGLLTDAEKANPYISKAVYPYCNGDCNLNIYGQYQYDVQQEGAASTRTRWAWYIDGGTNSDPYHVRILSRQSETYDGMERNAYFATMKPDDYDEYVTTLVWPNISGVLASEYMVLGNVGQYRLITTSSFESEDTNKDGIIDVTEEIRCTVNSLEQYWKTYDLIRRKVLGQSKDDYPDKSSDPIEVPEEYHSTLKAKGWHAYSKMAYAKRWNGYNAAGETKKGWESVKHWFQSVSMGAGYFDLIPIEISPALILLDQHGWEIMRKPLPYSDKDPDKEAKKDVLRTYDSPMVKEYIYWATAKKRTGFHQYYALDKRIGGSNYSSTSLGDLPPWGSENVLDSKGNHVDQYVTYIVKDEYVQSYQPGATPTAQPFLIRQGDNLAKNNGTTAIGKIPEMAGEGAVSKYIIDNINLLTVTNAKSNELWYVRPNANIDTEMGYTSSNHDWKDNPNAYEESHYSTSLVADLVENTAYYKGLSADDKKDFITKYGHFTFSNGFDPYNVQIVSVSDGKYFTTAMTSAKIDEGIIVGDYTGTGGSTDVTLKDKNTTPVVGTGYDNGKWAMTNQTFMAVQDMNGNMQLMPRFDHTLRMQDFSTLVTPTEEAEQPEKLKKTYTQLYRPFVYNYLIIDNDGYESLRYQSGGDLVPLIPSHFKSPLAKDFEYYKTLIDTNNDGVYELPSLADKIDELLSLAGAGLTAKGPIGNYVYVRYHYDAAADVQDILKGKWLTMKLNDQDVQYDIGIKSETKPATQEDLKTAYQWHWKFLKNPYTDPDPYNVQLFNRKAYEVDANGAKNGLPMSSTSFADNSAVTANAGNTYQHFVLLSHTSGDYALAVARTKDYTYPFLNGDGMNTAIPAKIHGDGFTSTSTNYTGVNSQIKLTDEVINDYTYIVYTNGMFGSNAVKYGKEALRENQENHEASENDFVPTLPETARSPLLNLDQFLYYERKDDMGNANRELNTLYGLYGGEVYVRYQPYDPVASTYRLPNERNDVSEAKVARSDESNDAPLRFGDLPYNIFWHDDNIMKRDGTAAKGEVNQYFHGENNYVWHLKGDDPYAIKIMSVGPSSEVKEPKYVNSSGGLSDSPESFMLLPKDTYDYGVLAVTGTKGKKLTMDNNADGATLTILTTESPREFIIFPLASLKVIYHLVIANIDPDHPTNPTADYCESVEKSKYYSKIPYRDSGTSPDHEWNKTDKGYDKDFDVATDKKFFPGTTMRDLSSQTNGVPGDKYQLGKTIGGRTYCIDVGRISLGDTLSVPELMYRPNVEYEYYVDNIQKKVLGTWTDDTDLNNAYKGMKITSKQMGVDLNLIDKTIVINIRYKFMGGLDTNSGNDFVKSVADNKWYTVETMIDNTPWLAQYTNAWGFELKEGRGSHFTNDYLWTPVGDPYGFQLYNRYTDRNSGANNLGDHGKAIGSNHSGDDMEDFKQNKKLVMNNAETEPTTVYELLSGDTPGYFKFHPVINMTLGTRYYFNTEWADDDGDGVLNNLVRLNSVAREFTFGLTKELVKPYFDRAGYVGGLTETAYKNADAALKTAMEDDDAELSQEQLMEAQTLVYNDANIVQFDVINRPGYYRLHSPEGVSDVSVRYASGYTHKTEHDLAIPMHFYEEDTKQVRTYTDLKTGFKSSKATQGDLPVLPVNRDPASIFYFSQVPAGVDPTDNTNKYVAMMSTQGLYVKGEIGKEVTEGIEDRPVKAKAYMIDEGNKANATRLFIMDIGGAILLIHDNTAPVYRKYLCYDQNNAFQKTATDVADMNTQIEALTYAGDYYFKIGENEPYTYKKVHRPEAIITTEDGNQEGWNASEHKMTATDVANMNTQIAALTVAGTYYFKIGDEPYTYKKVIYTPPTTTDDTENKFAAYWDELSDFYDMKLTHNTHTDHAKWCMQPVQKAAKSGTNEMGLSVPVKSGTKGYYYTTFCAPFDVLLTDAEKDTAYICKIWDNEILHLKKIGKFNNEANGCPTTYKGSNQFIPAGTPVIIRTKNAEAVTMALPTTTPSKALTGTFKDAAGNDVKNIFEGTYLEQLLQKSSGDNFGYEVYTFGFPFKKSPTVVTPDDNYGTNGQITIKQPQFDETGVGFFLNANPNRENGPTIGDWAVRNNKYVYGNKIFIRSDHVVNGARQGNIEKQPDFIPVVFDDDEEEEDEPIGESLLQRPHDNRVYDLLGRCVATGEEVVNGTWRSKVASGIYILNGRKIYVK